MSTNIILVIEDHPLFATGIKELVEFVATNAEIVCANSLAAGLELGQSKPPSLVITDLRLPDATGQGVIDRLNAQFPDCPLVIMSGDNQLLSDVRTSVHTASWQISKTEGFEQTSAILLEALTRARINVQWRPSVMSNRHSTADHISGSRGQSSGIQLTQKQQQVMQLLAAGMSNKEIARKLE
ncbi:MAG: response regulator transcription factor, partial [Limnobacter sp.]|nr:response regulator transcription factor [Limnobacter sp.]